VLASLLMVVGTGVVTVSLTGGATLEAAAVASTGFDIGRYLIWLGTGCLVISAILFISASSAS